MTSEPPAQLPAAVRDSLYPPARAFGRYRPIAVLGHGGMANVYLAGALGPAQFTKLVVLKVLKPELASSDPDFRSMFLDEARLAARLQHPNIVQTYEVFDDPAALVIVMEYLDGQPLSRVRHRMGTASAEAKAAMLRIVADMLSGLHYAHEASDYDGSALNVVHRDVSPHNIFVTYTGETKVVDFGVAKVADASARTQSGVIKGKLSYMAPEQAVGSQVDRRVDVFAAGLILWEIAAGRRVWKGLEDLILGRLNTGQIPSVRDACPSVPAGLCAIVDRATAARADDRYPSAAALREDLDNYLSTQSVRLTSPQVGAVVAQAFEKERIQMRSLIEEQMRLLRGDKNRARDQRTLPEIGASVSASESGLVSGPSPQLTFTDASSPEREKATTVSRHLPGSSPKVRNRHVMGMRISTLAAMGTIAGSIGIGIAAWRSADSRPARAAPSAAPSSASSEPPDASVPLSLPSAQPAEVRTVTLIVRAKPPKAKLFLDDAPLNGNPVELRRTADNIPHQIRATAPGFTARTTTVVADKDQTVDLSLQRANVAPGGVKPQGKQDPSDTDPGF
jgi:eukaryotic-like serine/threonine-protein kinase